MDLQLQGKVALVTGGSRGIGLAVAHELAREGVTVAILGRDRTALAAAAARFKTSIVTADTGDDASVQAAAQQVLSHHGRVDILVNCAAQAAGQARAPRAEEVQAEQLMQQMNVKVMGYLRMAQAVLPSMRENGWGRIISISGMGARRTGDTIGSIRNVAVVAMMKNLAEELAGSGVTANTVHPGLTKTEKVVAMIARLAQEQGKTVAEIEAGYAASTLTPHLATSEAIAGVVTFLASPRAAFVNGEAIAVNGGSRGIIHY